ncbi:MAG TPA: hypothetical protein VF516_18260 [Kofleriaceae bacterium]
MASTGLSIQIYDSFSITTPDRKESGIRSYSQACSARWRRECEVDRMRERSAGRGVSSSGSFVERPGVEPGPGKRTLVEQVYGAPVQRKAASDPQPLPDGDLATGDASARDGQEVADGSSGSASSNVLAQQVTAQTTQQRLDALKDRVDALHRAHNDTGKLRMVVTAAGMKDQVYAEWNKWRSGVMKISNDAFDALQQVQAEIEKLDPKKPGDQALIDQAKKIEAHARQVFQDAHYNNIPGQTEVTVIEQTEDVHFTVTSRDLGGADDLQSYLDVIHSKYKAASTSSP